MQCLGGSPGHCTSQHRPAPALHMLSFENFVKSMSSCLSELKVTPSFCFPITIRDNRAVTSIYYFFYFLSHLFTILTDIEESKIHNFVYNIGFCDTCLSKQIPRSRRKNKLLFLYKYDNLYPTQAPWWQVSQNLFINKIMNFEALLC